MGPSLGIFAPDRDLRQLSTMGRAGTVSLVILIVSTLLPPPASSAPIITITSGVTLASLPIQALVLGKLLFLKKLLIEGVLLDKILTKSDASSSSSSGQGCIPDKPCYQG